MAYKHDYDKILTRLVSILSRLNDGEALSVKELAEEFNTSERTIQRDFNERLISFPIYQDKKRWKMQDGFKLEKTATLEDAVVLDILEGFVSSSSGVFSQKAKKLLSKIKNKEYNPIYAKLDMEDISNKFLEIQLLESAIKTKTLLSCIYQFENYEKELHLKPLKIANYDGFWYLIALDGRNDLLKKYYLKNIKDIKLLEKNFHTDKKLETLLENSISVWFDDKKEPFEVKLFVQKEIAKYFKRKPISKTQKMIKELKDGSVELVLQITHEMEIIPLVKYWLPYIKVLKPQRIQKEIIEDLKEYIL